MPSNSLLKVLIVEDDLGYRRILSFWLQAKGCDVLVAGSETEALELAKDEDLDVLLADIGLPDSDGLTLARKLTEQQRIPRVFYMSAVSLERHSDRGLKIDPHLFLRKPFTQEELWDKIQ